MLPAGAGQRPKRAPAAAPVAPLLPLKAAPTAPSRPGGPLLRRPAARAVLLVLTLLVAHRLVQNAWWQSTAPAGTKQEAAPKQEAGSAPEVPAPQQERPRIRVRPPAELLPPQVAAASGDACAQVSRACDIMPCPMPLQDWMHHCGLASPLQPRRIRPRMLSFTSAHMPPKPVSTVRPGPWHAQSGPPLPYEGRHAPRTRLAPVV